MRVLITCAASALAVAAMPAAASAAPSHRPVVRHQVRVLGHAGLYGPAGVGWGNAHPSGVADGGDGYITVTGVHWQHWGDRGSVGNGTGYRYTVHRRVLTVQLRAYGRGRCSSADVPAYRHLSIRVQKPSGDWSAWRPWEDRSSICR